LGWIQGVFDDVIFRSTSPRRLRVAQNANDNDNDLLRNVGMGNRGKGLGDIPVTSLDHDRTLEGIQDTDTGVSAPITLAFIGVHGFVVFF